MFRILYGFQYKHIIMCSSFVTYLPNRLDIKWGGGEFSPIISSGCDSVYDDILQTYKQKLQLFSVVRLKSKSWCLVCSMLLHNHHDPCLTWYMHDLKINKYRSPVIQKITSLLTREAFLVAFTFEFLLSFLVSFLESQQASKSSPILSTALYYLVPFYVFLMCLW